MAHELNLTLQYLQNAALPMIGSSLRSMDDAVLWLESDPRRVHLVASPIHPLLTAFNGETEVFREGTRHLIAPLSPTNATALRAALPNLKPWPLGLTTSAGFGDRLGIATPGHVLALEHVLAEHPDAEILPVFAQQSIREMTRTRRTPREVLDDATWGAFEVGWKGMVGADADHLKTPADIDACVEVGFSFFTIDPGEYVDDEAHNAPASTVEQKVEALPWHTLESSRLDLEKRYVDQRIDLGGRELLLNPEAVLRAAAKYGAAIAHVAMMYRHLESKHVPFELEVSVDETETPTSHVEHVYIASELKRLGVSWISLAPRYVGRFEKGIDYIGNLNELRDDLSGHAAIARAFGPYKLSLHSGSDKFSVYPIIAEVTNNLVHLKTAGTSYLEALRVAANYAPEFFREVTTFAREHYEQDRASYHVSAELDNVPELKILSDEELPRLLEQDDARQVLHVTFGSVLDAYKPDLKRILRKHEAAHYQGLENHFIKHLEPFAKGAA